jgi:hypothetical protein
MEIGRRAIMKAGKANCLSALIGCVKMVTYSIDKDQPLKVISNIIAIAATQKCGRPIKRMDMVRKIQSGHLS